MKGVTRVVAAAAAVRRLLRRANWAARRAVGGDGAAGARRGFDPVSDRGQILVDMVLTQSLGSAVISDFPGLRHLPPVIGPVASTPTVWRALSETGPLQLTS